MDVALGQADDPAGGLVLVGRRGRGDEQLVRLSLQRLHHLRRPAPLESLPVHRENDVADAQAVAAAAVRGATVIVAHDEYGAWYDELAAAMV